LGWLLGRELPVEVEDESPRMAHRSGQGLEPERGVREECDRVSL
jgi:hypothetical protein